MATMIEITFPTAPPSAYLATIRHFRRLEERVREVPSLACFASDEGAPFDDDLAAVISGSLATNIHRQATEAVERGDGSLAPRIAMPPETARDVALRIDSWLSWLRVDVASWPPSLPEVMGLGKPQPAVLALTRALVEGIMRRVADRRVVVTTGNPAS